MGPSRSRKAPSRATLLPGSAFAGTLGGTGNVLAQPVAQVCREYCREGICRERCYNTRDDGDVTVGVGRQRTFDRDRDRRTATEIATGDLALSSEFDTISRDETRRPSARRVFVS
jgi:hypothetical protein